MEQIQNTLKDDSNIIFYPPPLSVVSIFDYTFYDRSDYDLLTQSQRLCLEKKLKSLGYAWKSGRELAVKGNNELPVFIFPKPSVQGAIPSDVFIHMKQADHEVLVLTPTQTACFLLKSPDKEKAKTLLLDLVTRHPFNIKKLEDLFRVEPEYGFFCELYHELIRTQENALKSNEKLRNKSHLGRF